MPVSSASTRIGALDARTEALSAIWGMQRGLYHLEGGYRSVSRLGRCACASVLGACLLLHSGYVVEDDLLAILATLFQTRQSYPCAISCAVIALSRDAKKSWRAIRSSQEG